MVFDPAQLATGLGFEPSAVLVLVQRPGRVVARIESGGRGQYVILKVDADIGAFAPEVAALQRLSAAGLPVPDIRGYTIGPPAVLALTWILGSSLGSESPHQVVVEAGQLLRRVHSLPGGPPFSGEPTIPDWINAWSQEIGIWWASNGGSRSDRDSMLRRLDRLQPLLSTRTGTLTLFDGRPDHFLFNDGHIVGLIDVHDVSPGDPAMDLAVLGLQDPSLVAAALRGYRPSRHQQAVVNQLIPFYRQLRCLSGAEWDLRHGNPRRAQRLLHLARTSNDD